MKFLIFLLALFLSVLTYADSKLDGQLWTAIQKGDEEGVLLALDQGADPNTTAIRGWDGTGLPVLDYAAYFGYIEIVKDLLRYKAIPGLGYRGGPLLLNLVLGCRPSEVWQAKPLSPELELKMIRIISEASNPFYSYSDIEKQCPVKELAALDSSQRSPFFVALTLKKMDLLPIFLASKNISDGDLGSALEWATLQNQKAVIDLLVSHGASFKAYGKTILDKALTAGNFDAAQYVINQGGQLDPKALENYVGWPLSRDDKDKQVAYIEFLLKNHQDPNIDNGQPLIRLAGTKEASPLIKILIKYHADVNVNFNSTKDQTPLGQSLSSGYLDNAQVLLENGAKVSKGDVQTALQKIKGYLTIGNGVSLSLLDLLVKAGLDLKSDPSLLVYANQSACRPDLTKYLIEKGLDVNLGFIQYSNIDGTPVSAAIRSNCSPSVNLLLKAGAQVTSVRNDNGVSYLQPATALDLSFSSESLEILKTILEANQITANDILKDPQTQLRVLTSVRSPEILEYLIQSGIDVTATNKNLIFTYVGQKNIKLVKALLKAGADPNVTESVRDGTATPAQIALGLNDVQMVMLLCAFHAKDKICNY